MHIDQLFNRLRDHQFHSGSALAQQLGVTRARIWQQMANLEGMGVPIWRVRGRGYRLSPDFDVLQQEWLLANLADVQARIDQLQVVASISSTNAALMNAPLPGQGYSILTSEHQSAGRGRQGKPWITPMGTNIAVSFALARVPLARLEALSLCLGVALARVLEALGVADVRVKWPNDVYIGGAKVAGILVELKPQEDAAARLVVGLGVNLGHSFEASDLGQPSTHVNAHLPVPVGRNPFLARLIRVVMQSIDAHLAQGLAATLEHWPRFDYLHQQSVVITRPHQQCYGLAMGLDGSGRLLVQVEDEIQAFDHGEVSVRVQQ